jgi:probable blue pigment (indigoidine) exporter
VSGTSARDVGLVVLLGTLWGVSFTAIDAGLADVAPVFFAAVRYDLAALLMLAVAFAGARRDFLPHSVRQWGIIGVSAVLNVAGYHAFLYWGQQTASPGIAAVIVGLNPIMAMVVARALLPGERVGAGGFLGLVLGLSGLAVLIGLRPDDFRAAQGLGELLVFGAVLCWAFGAVLVKRSGHGMRVVPFTALQMALGAIVLHLVSLVIEGPHPRAEWSRASIVSLLYLTVVASGFGFFLYFTLLERIGPVRSSLVSYVAPAAAALSALLVLHEPLEFRMVVAFVLILAGFRLVVRGAARASTPDLAPAPGAAAPPDAGDRRP